MSPGGSPYSNEQEYNAYLDAQDGSEYKKGTYDANGKYIEPQGRTFVNKNVDGVFAHLGSGSLGFAKGLTGSFTGGVTDPLFDMSYKKFYPKMGYGDPNDPRNTKSQHENAGYHGVYSGGQIGGGVYGMTRDGEGGMGEITKGAKSWSSDAQTYYSPKSADQQKNTQLFNTGVDLASMGYNAYASNQNKPTPVDQRGEDGNYDIKSSNYAALGGRMYRGGGGMTSFDGGYKHDDNSQDTH